MRGAVLILLSCVVWSVGVGCSEDEADSGQEPGNNDTSQEANGELLFMMPHQDGNTYACYSCHALEEPASDGFARAGHALGGATRRESFKNGQFEDILDAVNICRTEWMGAPAFAADDERWQALRGFMDESGPEGPVEALTFEVVEPLADTDGGDVEEGRDFFNASCALCHGQNATGTQQAPALVGEFLNAGLIARRVRTSGEVESGAYEGLTGGRMPFWAADRINDDQLRDVLAFVLQHDPGGEPDENDLPDDLERQCDSTHPSVGRSGVFSDFSHDIGGVATIVDDCTIEISAFAFDGGGINVQVYAGLGGDYDNGFSISGDLRRAGGYDGTETIFVQLPEGRTLDELDGVSIWCVPVGINFGDARFE